MHLQIWIQTECSCQFLAHPVQIDNSMMLIAMHVGSPSSVRPSVHSFQNALFSRHLLTVLEQFWFWLFHKIGLGMGDLSTMLHSTLWNSLSMVNSMQNVCEITIEWLLLQVISRPILIVIALFGRCWVRRTFKLSTTELIEILLQLINYGNLCKFSSKNNKNCFFSHISWPIFILFILSQWYSG